MHDFAVLRAEPPLTPPHPSALMDTALRLVSKPDRQLGKILFWGETRRRA